MGRPDWRLTSRLLMPPVSDQAPRGLARLAAATGIGLASLTVGCHQPSFPKMPTSNEPRAEIVAPAEVHTGDLVILDAGKSTASDFAWALAGSNKEFLPVDGGRRCVFSSGTRGRFIFVLAVASADRVALATHTVEVKDTSPPEPSGPDEPDIGPDAPDGPDVPDPSPGKFALAKLARDWVLDSVPASPSRLPAARSLASSFRSLASAIAAGTLADPASILEATRTSNRAALGDHAADWDKWSQLLATKLEDLHRSGKLKSPADFQTAWEEVSLGLEGVK